MKVKRKIIKIDEEKYNGCGSCIPNCPEQALQIIDTPKGPKAKLVKEFYCDGLGACLSSCPTGALTIEEKEANAYNEEATIARIKEVAPEILGAHLKHLAEHSQELPKSFIPKIPTNIPSCHSAQVLHLEKEEKRQKEMEEVSSELKQWPIQLHLVPPSTPYFNNVNLMLVADCVPFAYANFHQDFLKDNAIAIGCPKLDDVNTYIRKVEEIIRASNIKSIKIVHMVVPCCHGLVYIAKEAVHKSGEEIPLKSVVIGINGKIVKK